MDPMAYGKGGVEGYQPFAKNPLSKNSLQTETSDADSIFCFAQMCPIPSCTTSPGCCSRVRSRSWNVHDGYDISFMGYSHIQRLGGLYIQFQIQYGTTGYHWYKGIYAGCWPGLQGGDPNMMGIQDSINVNHQCPLINLKKASILGEWVVFAGEWFRIPSNKWNFISVLQNSFKLCWKMSDSYTMPTFRCWVLALEEGT